jgi:transcriptional regulator with XRE-family HTH domain
MMNDLRRLLAANMKAYRSLRGLSQMKLAEKVNTAPNYIAMIESGRKFPSDKMLERIASALAVNPGALFSLQTETDINFQIHLLKDLYKEIGTDIADLLSSRIKALEKKTSN